MREVKKDVIKVKMVASGPGRAAGGGGGWTGAASPGKPSGESAPCSCQGGREGETERKKQKKMEQQ